MFKGFDFFPKTEEDFKIKTATGGIISLLSLILVFFLFISEFLTYLQVSTRHVITVDDTSKNNKLVINLNISFPAIPCEILSLDLTDISGELQVNIDKTVQKRALDYITGHPLEEYKVEPEEKIKTGNSTLDETYQTLLRKIRAPGYCGSCYGAETKQGQCCNTCEELKKAYSDRGWALQVSDSIEQCVVDTVVRKEQYSKKEGCNIHGFFMVNKVKGNFHVSPGKTRENNQHDYIMYEIEHFNTSHIIHSLGFGQVFQGVKNPLDNTTKILTTDSGLFQYYIEVVPTIYYEYGQDPLTTNQFSVTTNFIPRNKENPNTVPGVFFMYDLSPIMVHIKEEGKSFLHFITKVCALIGGVFTIASIFDSIVYRTTSAKKK